MDGLIFGILRYLILDWLWQTAFSLSCADGNFEPVRSVCWSALRDGFEDTSNAREVKHHINVKRQTRICTTWPSFLITCLLLFIISTPEVVVSCNFFIHKNCFELFLSANFLYWEILNLKLTIAVFATLRLRGRPGKDCCQRALWDCFGGWICRHFENASATTVPQSTLTTTSTRSPAQPQIGNWQLRGCATIWDKIRPPKQFHNAIRHKGYGWRIVYHGKCTELVQSLNSNK